MKRKIWEYIQRQREKKGIPDGLKKRFTIRCVLLFLTLILSITFMVTKQNLFARFFLLILILVLFDTIRYGYYLYFGKWDKIEGICILVGDESKARIPFRYKNRNILIQSKDDIYTFPIPEKANVYEVGVLVTLYIPKTSYFLEIDGARQINSVLYKEISPGQSE